MGSGFRVPVGTDFAFVHIPRTGGVSITAALRDSGRPMRFDGSYPQLPGIDAAERAKIVTMYPFNTPFVYDPHLRLSVLRDLGAIPEGAFTFGFVRNPWDLVVSVYTYAIRQGMWLVNFERFLEEYVRIASDQTAFLCDADGGVTVDFVGRFESLAADFAHVAERLGIAPELPHLNRLAHRPYQAYYTPETRSIVADFHQRDIAIFGYAFGEQLEPVASIRIPPPGEVVVEAADISVDLEAIQAVLASRPGAVHEHWRPPAAAYWTIARDSEGVCAFFAARIESADRSIMVDLFEGLWEGDGPTRRGLRGLAALSRTIHALADTEGLAVYSVIGRANARQVAYARQHGYDEVPVLFFKREPK